MPRGAAPKISKQPMLPSVAVYNVVGAKITRRQSSRPKLSANDSHSRPELPDCTAFAASRFHWPSNHSTA